MINKRSRAVLLSMAAAGLSLAVFSVAQDQSLPTPNAASSNACLTCHTNPVVNGIRETVHGQASVPESPFALGGCTVCHGPGEDHLRSFQSPDFVFGDGGGRFPASAMTDQSQQCLNCHQSEERVHWAGSEHQSADLGCTTCHNIHQGPLNVASNPDICLGCHLEKRGQLNRRSHHPVLEGLMGCTSCHNPHGSAAPSLLVRSDTVETCITCHAEKKGPFLWEHQPATEDCTTCHNPHGTNQMSMLSVREPFLCQNCHSDVFHPSTLYSGDDIPPLGAAQQLLGSSCTNCHSAVHGSNHPSGSRFTR